MAVPAVDVHLDTFPTHVEHAAPEIVLPGSRRGLFDVRHGQQVVVVGPCAGGVVKLKAIKDILVIEKGEGAVVLWQGELNPLGVKKLRY